MTGVRREKLRINCTKTKQVWSSDQNETYCNQLFTPN